jgi:hypothetical protein
MDGWGGWRFEGVDGAVFCVAFSHLIDSNSLTQASITLHHRSGLSKRTAWGSKCESMCDSLRKTLTNYHYEYCEYGGTLGGRVTEPKPQRSKQRRNGTPIKRRYGFWTPDHPDCCWLEGTFETKNKRAFCDVYKFYMKTEGRNRSQCMQ